MHKTAIDYALAFQFRLGRNHHGYYTLKDAQGNDIDMSYYPTAKSAIQMMRRHLRYQKTEARCA